METFHSDTGGGTKDINLHVPHMGDGHRVLHLVCPDVYHVRGARDDDGHKYQLIHHSPSEPLVILRDQRDILGADLRQGDRLRTAADGNRPLHLGAVHVGCCCGGDKEARNCQSDGISHEDAPGLLRIFWQIPQYFLLGATEVCTFIGQLEFFYDQFMDTMWSLCSTLSLLTMELGNYLSSLILTLVTYFTTWNGKSRWISNNLNEGHLDYFWLLAGLSFSNMVLYLFCASNYKQKRASCSCT